MKNFLIFVFFLPVVFCAAQQKKVEGFYKGTLFNDSTKMVQQYELVLAEYRGKIMGYSYVTFVVNDTFYYGIRKIKAKIDGDSLIVEDDKIIANNFPEAPAKHVNRIVTIPFNGQDSLVSINGRWKTNRTKIYYAVPGSVQAGKSTDSSGSALFAHLKELGLMPNDNYVATETKMNQENKIEDKSLIAKTKDKSKEKKKHLKTEEKTSVGETRVKEKENKIKTKPPATEEKETVIPFNQRKEHLQQTIIIQSDSLMLSFYDNGVVDGDIISVYLNGQPVITNALLKSVATKKAIYVGGMNEVKLVLVAENLGSIPPNTGLLIIRDGDRSYNVNFTADMQTNASIILKGNKNQ